MSDGVFISDRPQLAIARQTVSFASLGLNDPTLTRIIYEVGNPYLSYVPTDEFNPISGITEGKSYLLYLNSFFDGSPALANAVLTNLIPQTSTNVFAGERVVFLCTSSVSFATAGITTSNTNLITLVSEGYFTSYDPNDTINGIDGFVEGELYDIDPITDIDLHLYGVTKIRYSDEVLYLDSLEDVVVTNSNPDATLPLDIEETLVRNATTGVWENQKVSVKFVADEASRPATGIENIVYVAKAEKTSWYWDGAAYQQIGGGGGTTPDLQAVTDVGNLTNNAIATTTFFQGRGDAGLIVVNPSSFQTRAQVGKTGDIGFLALYDGTNSSLGVTVKPSSALTANREIALPNKSGTFALLDDITGGTSYTDEQAQDAVGTILSSEFTYDDATPQISINSIPYSKISGTPSIPTDTNIYNTDGTLAGNRTITGNNKYLAITGGRWEEAKGADVAAANDLTLGNDGNTFKITGATQINAITNTNWQAGSGIFLIFASTPTIKHNTAGGAGTSVLLLSGGVDYIAAANDVLSIIYDGTSWHEVGRKLAAAGSGINALAAIGVTPNANGASISGSTLNLQPASNSFGGVVTTTNQVFAGTKDFNGQVNMNAGATATTIRITSGFITIHEIGTISTPAAGRGFLYAKNDGLPWYKNSAGTEFELSHSNTATATNADFALSANTSFQILPTITANRTMTIAAGYAGRRITIWNKNSAGFAWNFSGTVVDAAETAITSIPNDTIWQFISDGTNWIKL